MRVLLLSMRAMLFMVMRGIFCYGCCDVVVVVEATALATTPDRRVPLLRVRAILAPQFAESGRLLGLRETEFGDPLAVGAELIGHAQGVLFVQNWDERKLAVFIAFVFQFGEDFRVDVERRERGSLAVEFSSRGFWRPLFEHSATVFRRIDFGGDDLVRFGRFFVL